MSLSNLNCTKDRPRVLAQGILLWTLFFLQSVLISFAKKKKKFHTLDVRCVTLPRDNLRNCVYWHQEGPKSFTEFHSYTVENGYVLMDLDTPVWGSRHIVLGLWHLYGQKGVLPLQNSVQDLLHGQALLHFGLKISHMG